MGGDYHPCQNDRSAEQSANRGNLADGRNEGAEYSRSDRFSQDGEIYDVRRKKLESPVHSGMAQQHRTEGQRGKNCDFAWGLRTDRGTARHGNQRERNESRRVDDCDVGPDAERRTQTTSYRIVDRSGHGGRKREEVASERAIADSQSALQVRSRDYARAEDGDSNPGDLSLRWRLSQGYRRYRGYYCRLQTDEGHRRRDSC